MIGGLENSPKEEKISQYCGNDLLSSCKVFLFIMSDSKLVHIAFMDAASYLPPPFYLLWCQNHAAVAFAPFLLILLKSGPTDDETFLPFSGSLWKRFLIFKAEKNVRSFAFQSRPQSQIRISHITISRNENKRHDHHFQKMSSTYHIVCSSNTGGWGEAAPGCEDLVSREVFCSHSHDFTPEAKYNQHVGLFRLFSPAAWWWWRRRSSCLIHR